MNQKQKILIVDDDPSYRQLYIYQLTRAGYEVLIAHDGKEALNWLRYPHNQPDLAVVDLLMPYFSGIEVLERIKALPYKLPVILVSGAEWPIAREGVAQSLPDAFVSKPCDIMELVEKITLMLKSFPENNS
jgi:twitching motility two-component system response regulator PilH